MLTGEDAPEEEDSSRVSHSDSLRTRSERANIAVSATDKRKRNAVHIAALANVGSEMLKLVVSVAANVNGKDVRLLLRTVYNTIQPLHAYDTTPTGQLISLEGIDQVIEYPHMLMVES